MGLDMNLYRKLKTDTQKNEDGEFVSEESILYWRKANQIFGWFGRNVANNNLENCEYYPVTQDNLIELQRVCKQVLDAPDRVATANELLPTQSLFFFGSTEYEDWYFDQLSNTVEELQPLIEADWDGYDVFFYAWW